MRLGERHLKRAMDVPLHFPSTPPALQHVWLLVGDEWAVGETTPDRVARLDLLFEYTRREELRKALMKVYHVLAGEPPELQADEERLALQEPMLLTVFQQIFKHLAGTAFAPSFCQHLESIGDDWRRLQILTMVNEDTDANTLVYHLRKTLNELCIEAGARLRVH